MQNMIPGLRVAMILMIVLRIYNAGAQFDTSGYCHLTIADGLSDNTITSMLQDDMGYIWIGTHHGLNRYDGQTFTKYMHKSGDQISVPHNYIFRLKNLGNDRLAIVTRGGIQILHTRSSKSTNFIISDTTAHSIPTNNFWDIIEIKSEGYLASSNTGFYFFNYEGGLLWRYDHYSLKDAGKSMRYGRNLYEMPDGKILCYYEDLGSAKMFDPKVRSLEEIDPALTKFKQFTPIIRHNGGSMISISNYKFLLTGPQREGVRMYDLQTQTECVSPVPIRPGNDFGWPGYLVNIDDNLIAQTGASGGFFLFQKKKEQNNLVTDSLRHFSGHRCTALMRDKDNRWWIGTEYGVYMQSFFNPSIISYPVRQYIIQHAGIKAITEVFLTRGKVYFSAGVKDGVTVLDASTFAFEKQIRLDHPVAEWNDVFTIGSFNEDTLWIGTRMGLVWHDIATGKSGLVNILPKSKGSTSFISYFKDSRSNIWMGVSGEMYGVLFYHTGQKKFTYFSLSDTANYFPMHTAKVFTEDHQGNIWAGSRGLTRFNYESMKFDTFMTVLAGYRKHENNIMALSADRQGNLWFSSDGNGLIQYNISSNTYTTYTSSTTQLSSDLILALSSQVDNKLLIGTRSNINLFDLNNKEFRVLDQKDGMSLAPISTSFVYDSLHQVFLAGYDGEISAIPAIAPSSTFPIPELLIEYIEVAPDIIINYPASPVSLSYQHNNLQVHFTYMDFDGSDHVSTWYRLEPDGDWIDLNRSNTIFLGNLSHGHYELAVRITSLTERWPEQVRAVSIRIHPPFWKTTWFSVLIILLLVSAGSFFYRNHIRKIQVQANIDKLLTEYEMKALHSQMNPHFIFNCLNSIKEIILLGDKDKAGYYLSQFAQLIRDTLEHSKSSFITLDQLIDYLKRYIEMEKIRFSDFNYSIEIDPELVPRGIKMLPMLVQPLIENAIWHGLSQITGEKKLEIQFHAKGERLICIIKDNGPGINQTLKKKNEFHTSTGIKNIRKRIDLLNQKNHSDSSLKIRDRRESGDTETGTVVELDLFLDIE